jgi:lipoprotein-anchoring transpeptidase ErfK/SrfK
VDAYHPQRRTFLQLVSVALGIGLLWIATAGGVRAEELSTSIGTVQTPDNELMWVEVSLADRVLRLHQGDRTILKEMTVAVGKSSTPTPTGNFEVMEMVENPIWQNPWKSSVVYQEGDPANPLGVRWIGFKKAGEDDYGIHGTENQNSLGKAITHGCIRLSNEDVSYLYDQLEEGTPVVIH